MFIGDIGARTKEQAARFRQLTYTCMDTAGTRDKETVGFPNRPCKESIMTSLRFPTCWDGKNLDSPDHMGHMSYPETGTFESAGPCPASHPVRTSQLMYEVIWDTKPFNNKADWPADGSQPFVWSFGDATGYANHGDYVFGWKNDALQKILDTSCYASSCGGKQQSIAQMNKCALKAQVSEEIDGCKFRFRSKTVMSRSRIIADTCLQFLQGLLSFPVAIRLNIVKPLLTAVPIRSHF